MKKAECHFASSPSSRVIVLSTSRNKVISPKYDRYRLSSNTDVMLMTTAKKVLAPENFRKCVCMTKAKNETLSKFAHFFNSIFVLGFSHLNWNFQEEFENFLFKEFHSSHNNDDRHEFLITVRMEE
jgi:hypothetical protein